MFNHIFSLGANDTSPPAKSPPQSPNAALSPRFTASLSWLTRLIFYRYTKMYGNDSCKEDLGPVYMEVKDPRKVR